MAINVHTYGLTDLGYKIFLDRYATKDLSRESLKVGDTVVAVLEESGRERREIAQITAIKNEMLTLEDTNGDVYELRYDSVDKPLETDPEQMFKRIAAGIASVEAEDNQQKWSENFEWLLEDWKFIPGGRILAMAGTGHQLTPYNCFVLNSVKDSRDGIIEQLGEMTEIMSRGGGVGFNLSALRPKNSYVKGVNGRSSGAVSFGGLYSFMTGLVQQNGCVTADTRVQTNQGLLKIIEIVERIEAGDQSLKAWTHQGWRPITDQFRNGVKPVYRLKTDLGYEVEITENHPLMVFNPHTGDFEMRPVGELEAGDYVSILVGELEDHQAEYQTLEQVELQPFKQRKLVNLPTILTEDLAYLVGYYMANGYMNIRQSTTKGSDRLSFSVPHDRSATEQTILEKIQTVFGVPAAVYSGDGAVNNVSIFSKTINEFLIINHLKKDGSYNAFVPEQIFRSPVSVMKAFIGGWFAADGSNKGKKGGLQISTVSQQAAIDLQKILLSLGVASNIYRYDRPEEDWRDIYYVCIVGSWASHRAAAWLRDYTDKIEDKPLSVKNHAFAYPYSFREKYYATVGSQLNRRVPHGNKNTSQYAIDLIREVEIDDEALADHADMLGNCIVSRIQYIESIGEAETFDITVDETHMLSFNGIYGSNSRRGALMLILNDWHPDLLHFINAKREAGKITNANISVGVSDAFMTAVEDDASWTLRFPDTSYPKYDEEWDGQLEKWINKGYPTVAYQTLNARDIWNAIIESAWSSAEPGLWFRDRSNYYSNSYYYPEGELIATNPCVTGDTRIYTDQGLITAQELFDNETDIQVTIDGRFGLENATTPSTRVFMTGKKPVYRLQTREGYSVRATADHRFMTPRGWVELKDLQPGDSLHILNRKGGFGTEGSLEEGRMLGGLDHMMEMAKFSPDREVNISFGLKHLPVLVPNGFERYLEVESVPTTVFSGSEAMQRGFVQAIYVNGGFVSTEHLELYSPSLNFLKEMQMILSNFGIASTIRASQHHGNHLLVVTGSNILRFHDEIGFADDFNMHELPPMVQSADLMANDGLFLAHVESIIADGIEDVYDLTEPVTHSMVVNGLVTHQCGEQPLPGYSVCNLGAINLGRFHTGPMFAEVHDPMKAVDWDKLKQTVHYAVRFLDNVIDHSYYFMDENRQQQLGERRVGLGIMGLAELMIRCGVAYGSAESIEFIDRVMAFIAKESYLASADLAVERGSFPKFEVEPFLKSGFMQGMPEDVREAVREKGIRNVTLNTIAPTGCVVPDTLISTSSGLQSINQLGDTSGDRWQSKTNLGVMTDTGLKTVDKFYVNGFRETIRITTRRGYSIEATPNHRVRAISQSGEYVWRRMDEIEHEDTLVLWRDTAVVSDGVALVSAFNQDHHNSNVKSLPTYMTPELAEILGFYMGNGYTKSKGGLHLAVNAQDTDLIDHLSHLSATVFGVTPTLEARQGCVIVNIFGRSIKPYFEANGFAKEHGNRGEGAASAFIPEAVLASGRNCIAAFLRGLFESDGTLHRHVVDLRTTSKTLAKQVQVALLSLGIPTQQTIYLREHVKNAFGRRPQYSVRTVNQSCVAVFRDEIGFISTRKNSGFDGLRVGNKGDVFKVESALKDFYRASEGLSNTVRRDIISHVSHGSATLSYVREKVAEYPQLGQTVLGDLAMRGAFFDTVDQIEQGQSETFDLSVPDTHTYIANGFVSHNTTSSVVNTSGGIEPYFSWVYYRKGRLGMHEVQSNIVQDYAQFNPSWDGSIETLPDYFVSAMDLTPEEHIRTMAAAQRWVDSAISKTANLPNDYTVEQTADLYRLMYESGCKGGTVYRDGSRDEQVLSLKKDETPAAPAKSDEPASGGTLEPGLMAQIIDSIKAQYGPDEFASAFAVPIPPVVPSVPTAPPAPVVRQNLDTPRRSQVLKGITFQAQTPYNVKAYVVVNEDADGSPFEVFVTVGKAGSDLQAQAESIGRLLSIGMQMIEPHLRREALARFVGQLEGIGGTRSYGLGENHVRSLPDAIAHAIRKHYLNQNGYSDHGEPVSAPANSDVGPIPTVLADNGTILAMGIDPNKMQITETHPAEGVIVRSYIPIEQTTPTTPTTSTTSDEPVKKAVKPKKAAVKSAYTELCPSCQNYTLMRSEGCKKCESCGFSQC